MGLVIVAVLIGMIYNFFQKRRGNVSLPGVSVEDVKQEQAEDNQYVVKPGDSLWKIAVERYGDGYQWTKIAQENNLSNPGKLYRGQKLKLPEIKIEEKSVVTIDTGQDYKVETGDSLWKIAVKAYGDGYRWVDIYQENKVTIGKNPGLLRVGMVLKFPKT